MPQETQDNKGPTRIYWGGNGGTDQKNAEDILSPCRIMLSFYHIHFRVNDSNRRAARLTKDAKDRADQNLLQRGSSGDL